MSYEWTAAHGLAPAKVPRGISLELGPGDLSRLVAFFTREHGTPPAVLGLHPWLLEPEAVPQPWRSKYRDIAAALSQDIAETRSLGLHLVAQRGLLSWQVAVSSTPNFALPPPATSRQDNGPGVKGLHVAPRRGRPRKADGEPVSRWTLARRQRRALQET